MSIVQTFNKLALEFLEKEVEEFELDFAANSNKYENTIEEFRDFAGYQNHNKFDPFELFSVGLDNELDDYVKAIKYKKYDIIFEQLDNFLQHKGIKEYLDIDKKSSEYIVLARHFAEAKIDAIIAELNIIKGKSYEYKLVDKIETTETTKPIKSGPEERSSTYNMRVIINKIAARMREDYATTPKYILAADIVKELEEKHNIKMSENTILRHYSSHF